MSKVIYVVGSKVRTMLTEVREGFYTVPTDGPEFHTSIIPRYYRDTRKESGHSDMSDIFTSSTNPHYATKYNSYEEAKKWNEEFLQGEGVVYRF